MDQTHLTVIDHESLAEAGLTVREPVHACITCRFSIKQGYYKDDICGARGYKDIKIWNLNIKADCKVWEQKVAVTKIDKSTPLATIAVTSAVTSAFWFGLIMLILAL